ncbi:glycine zipper family protein [Planktomarina sp.]|jgi:uncharacterized protein YcfJ|nr:glycine zipper family protein [Planktomarina sp.]|tara:strand:- start:499 stop:933 length:435 start_codon:yes stop_codon:yes gene_type:complete
MFNKANCYLFAVLILTACATSDTLVDYSPIVDREQVDMKKFDKDLVSCKSLALDVEADYRERQNDQAMSNILAGAVAGAVTGAVVGSGSGYQSELTAYGAASGMAAGAASNDYTYDLVKFGPRRVIDRCMVNRGHVLLNDIGRG